MNKTTPWTTAEENEAIDLRSLNATYAEIAKELSRSVRSVEKKFAKLRKSNAPHPAWKTTPYVGMEPASITNGPTEKTCEERAAYWKTEAHRLQGVLSSQQHNKMAVEILVEKAVELAPISYQPRHDIFVRTKKGPVSEQSAVLVFSDTHVGQVIKSEQTLGMGGYDFEIFLRRLARLERSIFSILKDHTTSHIPEIVVAMLGDMIHGNLSHSVEAGQVNTVFTQFYSAGHAIAQFLRNLSTIAPVRVHTAVGNHCVDKYTEILTKRGWLTADELTKEDKCLGMFESGFCSWQPINKIVREKRVDRMVSIKNRQFDFRGTEHHRFYFRPDLIDKTFEARWSDISKFVSQYSIHIPSACFMSGTGEGVPDQLIELYAAVMTDGSVSSDNQIIVYQNPRKEGWVKAAFEKSGLAFTRRSRERNAPREICGKPWKGGAMVNEVSYRLSAEAGRQFVRLTGAEKGKLASWTANMTQDQFDRFLRALLLGDGTEHDTNSPVLFGKSKKWLGEIQALCLQYGWTSSVSPYQPNNTNPNVQYRLNLTNSQFVSVGARAEIKYESGTDEEVWCVETPSENFFCRRNGKSYLTGNTRWGTQKKMPTDNRFSNLDQFLYSYLAALLRDVPSVSIKLDEQPFSRFDVQGFHFLAGHGDHLRGGDKNLGIPNHAIGRNVNVHSQLAMRSGNPVPNYFLVGHLHRPITIPHTMGEFIVNGGFPGIDGYALAEAFNSSFPSQKLFLVHKKFGRSATYDLRLDLGDQTPHNYQLPDKFCCK